ncbi:MAG: helix-turn-helix transcriptional regulator [Burkholderiales bacterium]|nr:helix-turn-helix transcriptional regulator [Burkholderiales bacterium]
MDAEAFPMTTARLGPHVESVRTEGGIVRLLPVTDLRVRVHTGEPVRGFCRTERFTYDHGDVDVVAPGQSESWTEDGPARSVVVRFSPLLLERTAEELGLPPGRSALPPRHKLRDPQLAHIAWALDVEREAGSPNGRLYAESLGTAMALQLLGRYSVAGKVSAGMSAEQRRRVVEHVEAHLDGDLSLSALAGVAHSSVSHFKVLFRRTMGMPVHEYVMRRRVERAKELLVKGEIPAVEVALASGFSHQSHMARHMRKVLGVTPGMLRKQP